jgi:hypothetical protein
MGAIVALGGRVVVGIDVKCVIRAGLHARLTANASVVVKIDNAVIPGVKSLYWANLYTRSVGAMIAAHDREYPPCIGKFSLFNLFYVGSVDTNRHIVFTFTGGGACVTTDAFSVVNYKSVSHGKEASF